LTGFKLSVRIVVLNYNGQDLLPLCLPSIAEAVKRCSYPAAVTVLDNGSTDNSLNYVRKNFPEMLIETAPANRLLCSYNDYLPKMTETVAMLLNNDIRVDPGFLDPVMARFTEDPNTFLVASKVLSFDGTKLEAARTKAGFRFGLFWCDPGHEKEADTMSDTFSAGFGAFSREKFLELGGYDDRYLPGIYEDVDLCLRGRRAGYTLYYEPRSVVYHMGQASFKKAFGSERVAVIAHRNSFLFMWKNFRSPVFWISHLFFLPLRLFYAWITGNKAMVRGFFAAVSGAKP
jgi:N-acetylglucosaminyl-diphospho-decaprenol L-rhamnosyltransferase